MNTWTIHVDLLGTYIVALLILTVRNIVGYVEIVDANGCESCTLRLLCRDFDSIIVVMDAKFETQENFTVEANFSSFPTFHPRTALNQRCAGANHCSFILTQDCPGADKWGLGNLIIRYACVEKSHITKYCNTEITLPIQGKFGISEGFVHNPGYPRFYLGQSCRWKIQAPPSQRVKITIFDLSLIADPNSSDCADVLEITDSEQLIYSSCEQEEPPAKIESGSDSVEIVLNASPEFLLPRRGVLFHYTAIGCPTPSTPKNAYLLFRNDTIAAFVCWSGFKFPDSKSSTRIVKCLGRHWNASLLDCENRTALDQETFTQELKPHSTIMDVKAGIADIVIPSIIIILLFVINSVVIFIIYKYRQRKENEFLEEEMGTFSVEHTSA